MSGQRFRVMLERSGREWAAKAMAKVRGETKGQSKNGSLLEATWRVESAQRPALEQLDRAVYRFAAAERRLRAKHQRTSGGIPRGRIRALLMLTEQHEATPSQLAREAEVNPATVTVMIEELTERGWLRRRPDDTDGRVWWISLTKKGRDELASELLEWRERFARSFADIPDHELAVATKVLDRLVVTFDSVDEPTA
jgi:DNA-binding MarR family transcriptional regulator